MEKALTLTNNGQESQRADENLLGGVAGLADDRVLAELLRLIPSAGGSVDRAVLGYSITGEKAPVVQPTGSANGSVYVAPFRAIIGSRADAATLPSPNPTNDTAELANWRDIRSGVYVGEGTGATPGLHTQSLAANSSGNPRWDLVYAAIAVDVGQNSVSRRVKDPTTGTVSTVSVSQYLASPVTVAVVTGTPGATPALPAVPADAAGVYNLGLAYVWVPNGFNGSSTVTAPQIRAYSKSTLKTPFRDLSSGFRVVPATAANDGDGTWDSGNFSWEVAGQRPSPYMPADWVGGKQIVGQVDLVDNSSANWSHQNAAVIDSSCDWRSRIFDSASQTDTTKPFCTLVGGGTAMVPFCEQTPTVMRQLANSFGLDGTLVASTSTIVLLNHTNQTDITAGAVVGLYVDHATGQLKLFVSGTPNVRVFFWVRATAQMPNV